MAIEIVDFPINSMVIFHCYVNVCQAGYIVEKEGFMNGASRFSGNLPYDQYFVEVLVFLESQKALVFSRSLMEISLLFMVNDA